MENVETKIFGFLFRRMKKVKLGNAYIYVASKIQIRRCQKHPPFYETENFYHETRSYQIITCGFLVIITSSRDIYYNLSIKTYVIKQI